MRVLGLAAFLLGVGTFLLFLPVLSQPFINYDDPDYVTHNPVVSKGLTLEGLRWAFVQSHASNWHPLTWLSHMTDCQMYGLDPQGHHLTNVIIHTANSLLFLLLLHRLTGSIWRSLVAAALFSLHPLRVESVAWISERKDVLSGFFMLLTLLAYSSYSRGKTAVPGIWYRALRNPSYLLALALFACGLMSKPMLVTLPFVFLLLDCWPLRRLDGPNWGVIRPLLAEKIPFFILSIVSILITLWAQTTALSGEETASMAGRMANAMASLLRYLHQWIYPFDLAFFYPVQWEDLQTGRVLLHALILIVLLILTLLAGRKHPAVWVGACWYVGMLVPVLGLLQVGMQARADRYTYLPQMGWVIALVWLVADLSIRWRIRPFILATASVAVLFFFSWRTHEQIGIWQNDVTLWSHTLAVTQRNATAHFNLGVALSQLGRIQEAADQFQKALDIRPKFLKARLNMGVLLIQTGQTAQAIPHFQQAVDAYPSAVTHYYLGYSLQDINRREEAAIEFKNAVQLDPEHVDARLGQAKCLLALGRTNDAISVLSAGLSPGRNHALLENLLAYVLACHPDARYRNGTEAIKLAELANTTLGQSNPQVLATLACSYAEAGRMQEALDTARLAGGMVPTDMELHQTIRFQISQFEKGRPFRDPSLDSSTKK